MVKQMRDWNINSMYWNHSISCGHFLIEPYGMTEYWNIGHEKWKTDYPTKNVESTFFDDARQVYILWFIPVKYVIEIRKSIKLYRF